MKKRCARCKRDKSLDEFGLNPRYRDGRQSYCRLCHRDYDLTRKYGVTSDMFDAMLLAQCGLCAVCLDQLTDRVQVDHCHTSGKVRELLCPTCNRGLATIETNPTRYRAMVAYLAKHQPLTANGK